MKAEAERAKAERVKAAAAAEAAAAERARARAEVPGITIWLMCMGKHLQACWHRRLGSHDLLTRQHVIYVANTQILTLIHAQEAEAAEAKRKAEEDAAAALKAKAESEVGWYT